MQLAIAKFCFLIKDCWSQTSFNYGTTKGRTKTFRLLQENLFYLLVSKFQFTLTSDCSVMLHLMIFVEGIQTDIIAKTRKFFKDLLHNVLQFPPLKFQVI